MDFEPEIRRLTGKLRSVVKSHNIHNTLITIANPLSPASETYRHLQTVVKLGQKGKTVQTILVSSPDPGDGKSTTAANLAVVLAESGSRVLLVGADLRRPKVDSLFGFRDLPGFTDVLQGTTDPHKVIRSTPVEDLSIMPSGPVYSNSSKLLRSEILNHLIEIWRRDFAFVVFDSVPVLAAPDACIIAASVDLVFLVVSAGKTTLTSVRRAEEMLAAAGSCIGGVVLNRFSMKHAYGPYKAHPGHGYYGYTNSYSLASRDKSAS
jgi:capsular exopolysaccharide synthesis family protein